MASNKKATHFLTYILLLTLLALLFYFSYSYFMSVAYPLKYKKQVLDASKIHKIDKYLILAIIREESRFKKNSVSKKGAIGLMQLMPRTANWICAKRGRPYDKKKLGSPSVNIDFGSWYFSYLLKRYKRRDLALAAYNSGTGVMDRWLKENPRHNLKEFVYPETRDYVTRVIKSQKTYKTLYSEEI